METHWKETSRIRSSDERESRVSLGSRPPAIVPDKRLMSVSKDGVEIATSTRCIRVLETASPPTFYIPPEDVQIQLERVPKQSLCEWKGTASYWAYRGEVVGWSNEFPNELFARIKGYKSFYASKASCSVSGEKVKPQTGDFYGGWVISDVIGPYKGESGTSGW